MCGRYSLSQGLTDLATDMGFGPELFTAGEIEPLEPRYNIAPGQQAPVIVVAEEEEGKPPLLKMMRWGLVPPWAKDMNIGFRMINARSETVAEKPAFRGLLKSRRCLIPVDGFYEWRKKPGKPKDKEPFRFTVGDGGVFTLAGLWSLWQPTKEGQPKEGPPLESYTIITTAANGLVADIHDRMPVILAGEDRLAWLDRDISDPEQLKLLLTPFDPGKMGKHPVSKLVNSARNEGPEVLVPEEDQEKGLFD